MYVHTNVHVNVCIHACMHVRVSMCAFMYVYIFAYAHYEDQTKIYKYKANCMLSAIDNKYEKINNNSR